MKTLEIGSLLVITIFLIYKYIQVSNIDKDSESVFLQKGVILDVRTKMEFDRGHIYGAINMKMGDLFDGTYKDLDKKQTYYIYCSHGLRSIRVSNFLKEKGFENIINCGPMSEVNKYMKKN